MDLQGSVSPKSYRMTHDSISNSLKNSSSLILKGPVISASKNLIKETCSVIKQVFEESHRPYLSLFNIYITECIYDGVNLPMADTFKNFLQSVANYSPTGKYVSLK
ncbi:hypothetical protein TNCT_401 [Trichonephila clavata]|uniref:Uncharacterized protein n=1 Tax=Trichonephila clavata TaxID=2740835 RepID=A0A8X6HHD2_TRICU|nr:hypothetical protein TNCT_401 [Trichonephila clavata]